MASQTDLMTEFDQLRETWTQLGDVDPLWAILSDPKKEGGKWDVAAFFRSGRRELDDVLETLEGLELDVTFGTALDFGCGVGRLTQALSRRFEHSHGVDVAASMIEQADRFNQAPDRCTYHHNPRPDLSLFADATFDFIYSRIVLQHMVPDLAKGYVREFLRVVKPGGVVVFQVPAERAEVPVAPGQTRSDGALPDGAFRASIDVVTPGRRLRRLGRSEPKRVTVRVHNRGDATWPAVGTADGRFWIKVANQWESDDGTVVCQDDGRAVLPFDLRPGESAKVRLSVTAPTVPGRYVLVLDVVQEGVAWFQERGSRTTEVALDVVDSGAVTAAAPVTEDKPSFEMHSVPRAEIEGVIAECGGHTRAVLPDGSAGEAWVSWLYIVTG